MRIAILSIAFLLLAFAAQSQVLKSAGVWYFLDVDSMAARPAVLPSGTELAYVVGAKKIYYWHRGTSTWAEYGSGSTFNRDSIYFDSSIIGSGTVSDPWGVDSTLFATIAGVGDSIAAALGYVAANFFPLQGGTLTGTGGNGFVGFPLQSSPPSTPATGFSLFAGSTGNNISWMQSDGFFRRLVSPVTGVARQYQFMARSYTLGDSADIANNVTSIAANYIATSNGTNLVARNLFDNNTYVGILNNKPFQLGQWTTAGRPTGTTGYEGYNTTGNGKEWYQGSRWAYALESTFARGTATRIPFFDANGQINESASIFTVGSGTGVRANTFTHDQASNQIWGANNFDGTIQFKFSRNNNISSTPNNLTISFFSAATFQSANGIVWYTGNSANSFPRSSIFNIPSAIGAGYSSKKNMTVYGPVHIAPASATSSFTVDQQLSAISDPNLYVSGAIMTGLYNGTQMFEPDASAQLDVYSTTKGILPPRWTSAQLAAISSPATGLFGYQTNGTEGLYVKSASGFKRLLWTGDAATTWLKTELEAGRDVDITGGSSTDFRLRSNTRVQFDGKLKIGSDSSFTYNPPSFSQTIVNNTTSSSILIGGSGDFPGKFTIQDRNSSGTQILRAYLELDKRRSTFENYQWNLNEAWLLPNGNFAWTRHAKYDTVGVDRFRIVYGSDFADVPTHHVFKANGAVGLESIPLVSILAQNSTASTIFRVDINGVGQVANFNVDRTIQFNTYGTSATTAAALSKTLTNYGVGFATDGTVTSREIKRDTTIYVDDADYDWSAAITTSQIASRFNRVIFWMTTTAAAGSDSELTLHTPDANLLQVEYLIHSVDEPAGFDNKIVFGTNNAVDSTNGLVTNYYPAAGDGIHIRAGLRSGVYKYRYSN